MARPYKEDVEAAEAQYEKFHRLDPTKIGEFAKGFSIPKAVYLGGKGLWVTYRSGKVDPATLKKPRKPVDYVHEFEAGVQVYTTANLTRAPTPVAVPREHAEATALTKLGENLGFCFVDAKGDELEMVNTRPYPELYATPDGKCLVVVQSKKKVVAMIWGGGLGVHPRGIDG